MNDLAKEAFLHKHKVLLLKHALKDAKLKLAICRLHGAYFRSNKALLKNAQKENLVFRKKNSSLKSSIKQKQSELKRKALKVSYIEKKNLKRW